MRLWPSTDNAPWSHSGLSLQLGGMAILAVLHGIYLPPLCALGLLLLLAWRWLAARQRLSLPPRWLLLMMAVGGMLAVLFWFHTLLGTEAGVALVMWLAGCKTLETRSPRDAAGLSLLGLFLSFSLILHQQDLLMTAAVVGLTWLFTLSLTADRLPPGRRAAAMRLSAILLLQAVPLMAILFVAFPRLPGPLWQLPDLRPRYTTGVSATLSPGSVSNLVQSQAIAFRVSFVQNRPNTVELYWRGPVMSQFDGRGWGMLASERTPLRAPAGAAADYEITVEPHPMAWIYALDRPSRIPGNVVHFADGQVLAANVIRERQRFSVSSVLSERWQVPLSASDRRLNLHLPGAGNPRARAWGQQLQQRYPQPQARIRAVMEHFATRDYQYTLQPPRLPPDWIDAFLFDTRLGFCEHYAGSMAFVLRAAGIPARVVGGYLGAEDNPVGDYLIVRQSDAHAWLEAWIEGDGWIRLDPTGVVVPSRLSEGLEQALPAADAARLPTLNHALLRQMRFVWDSGQNRWNQWVIGYDDERRLRLLKKLGGLTSPTATALALIGAGILLSLGSVWLWLLFKQRDRSISPEQREWQRLQRWLTRRGFPRQPAEGPRDYLQRLIAQQPQWALPLRQFVELYLRLAYGHRQPEDDARQLRYWRRQLRAGRSSAA